jgi:hypothetical protein
MQNGQNSSRILAGVTSLGEPRDVQTFMVKTSEKDLSD